MTNISKFATACATLAASAALSGCIVVGANVSAEGRGGGPETRLLGVEISAREPEITITASSNGCTEKSQFTPSVHRNAGRYEVAFRRTTEDRCKALMAEGRRLTWTYSELGIPGGAEVVVLNRVGR